MKILETLSTHRVVQMGFVGAGAACLTLAAAGWWSITSQHKTDEEVQALQEVSLRVASSLKAVNDLILTANSKGARQVFDRELSSLRQNLEAKPVTDADLGKAIATTVQQIDALGKIAKPSPDNDDAMIGYGKLSVVAEVTLAKLDQAATNQNAAAAKQVVLLLSVQTGSIALALILVLACAMGVLGRLRRNLGGELEQAQVLMARVGQGDLRAIALHPQVSPHSVIGALAVMVDQLRGSIGQVQQSALAIGSASGEIAEGSQDLSQRTELNAGSLQQTASAMEELTTTIGQTADSARTAQQLARSASNMAEHGGSVVGQVVETMEAIQRSSRKISDIISTIDGIAFQTNILALNAAVEAARAGETGRGFAVVASEVRNLAQRSAAAAREIKGLITTSVEAVDNGTQLVSTAGQAMDDIVKGVQRVCDVIGEISTAAAEQSIGVGQINQSVTQLDDATQQNAALVEQTAAAAESLRGQAASLANVVAVFRIEGAATA